MSEPYILLTKEVRSGFTARVYWDESPQNPRNDWNPTSVHLWDEWAHMADPSYIRSYSGALYELYQKIYPELIKWMLLEEKTPPEIVRLLEDTPYPGVVRWISVQGGQQHRIEIMTSGPSNIMGTQTSGVAFIGERSLEELGLTREEGEDLIERDVMTLQQYINGEICILETSLDSHTHYTEEFQPEIDAKRLGEITHHQGKYTFDEERLDKYLLEIAPTDEDRKLIRTTRWKREYAR